MKRYEVAILVVPEIAEEEIKEIKEKISSFITENQGTIESISIPVRKKLGVPILKKEEALFFFLLINLEPEKVDSFGQLISGEKNILRHIIVTKKEKSVLKKSNSKTELKEIDKKIEEILKIGK